jgi:hypothetical protein
MTMAAVAVAAAAAQGRTRAGRQCAKKLCLGAPKKRVLHLARHKSQITNLRLLHTNTNEMWERSSEYTKNTQIYKRSLWNSSHRMVSSVFLLFSGGFVGAWATHKNAQIIIYVQKMNL